MACKYKVIRYACSSVDIFNGCSSGQQVVTKLTGLNAQKPHVDGWRGYMDL